MTWHKFIGQHGTERTGMCKHSHSELRNVCFAMLGVNPSTDIYLHASMRMAGGLTLSTAHILTYTNTHATYVEMKSGFGGILDDTCTRLLFYTNATVLRASPATTDGRGAKGSMWKSYDHTSAQRKEG